VREPVERHAQVGSERDGWSYDLKTLAQIGSLLTGVDINVEVEFLQTLLESYRAATVRKRLLGLRAQPLPYGRGST
jgi:hypothetical protein